ncbi:Polyketide synthase modules-related protein [Tenacibaculum discolor]
MKDLLDKIQENNLLLEVVDGKLKVFTKETNINKNLIAEIKANKEELIKALQENNNTYSLDDGGSKIFKSPELNGYPLSSSQQRLWTLSQMDNASVSYNMLGVYEMKGILREELLCESFEKIIHRHEILRTVFKEDSQGKVKQYVKSKESVEFVLNTIDLRNLENSEEELKSRIKNESESLFNLEEGSLLRGELIQVTNTKWVFCFVMHHIISDGWSIDIMMKELMEMYRLLNDKIEGSKQDLEIQYKDYAVWQQDQLVNGSLEEEKKYWLNHLRGELPVLSDFGDFPRPAVKTYKGKFIERKINTSLYQEFKALCSREEGTLFIGCLSLLNVFLHKYSGQEEFIIGSPVSGRTHAALHDQIGFYVNTLPLRNAFSSENSFAEVFKKVKKNTFEAFEHQSYPFDELLDDLHITRDLSRNALFDVMLVVQEEKHEQEIDFLEDGSLSVANFSNNDNHSASKFDLLFTFTELSEDLSIGIEYNSDIFSKSLVEQMLVHMEQLLANLIAKPSVRLSTISCLRREEKRELIEDYNATGTIYEAGTSILSLFSDQVALVPEKTALIYEDVSFTYSELDVLSTQLSHYLASEYGLNREDLIAIHLPKSPWQIISILGIMKMGCAYVPIASDYPQERIDYILSDTGSKVVITEELLSDFESRISEYSTTRDMELRTMSSLAYVMYTSGSTGYPKGVLVEDSGIIRLVKEANYVDIPSSTVVLSTGSFSFDATTFEYWGMLLNGGTLILSEESVFLSAVELSETIRDKGVTMMWFTSGLLNQLVDESIEVFEGLETLLTGGDRLSPIHIGKLKERYPSLELINGYGPTENTTFSICHRIQSGVTKSAGIPIGKPINNSSVYILDKHMNLVPKGVTGEIYLGGLGVSRGYLNRVELTQERFIASPFVIDERLYKTGDLGKWNQLGEVEFVGREDNQVKIRGFRIELGEIEHAMSMYPGVNSSLAIVEEAKGDKQIIGYVTSEEGLDQNNLRSWLSQRLPSYMVPSHLQVLEQFPLTVNGKVDRDKLPSIAGVLDSRGTTYLAPESAIEQKLSALWMELLNVPRVGLNDNFFELGGHSLKATKLMSKIHKDFNVKLRLLEIFNHPDLRSQSALIASKESDTYHAIPQLAHQESYPLSLMQRRLWILSQLEEANVAYNMPSMYVFKGFLEVKLLEESFQVLVSRHEILRTYFKKDTSGEVRQYIHDLDSVDFKIGFVDARNYSESDLSSALSKTLNTPFDLSEGSLLRINLYQVSEACWVFSSVIHHIICDGWSMEILIKELLQNYNSLVTQLPQNQPPLRIQYKDYASWQLESLKDSSSDKDYWMNHFSGSLPVLDLSGGKTRPAVKTYNGDVYERKFSKELSNKLARFLQQEEVTLFMGLLGVVNALFYHYTSQEDIIIGSPISGRDHRDLEDQIGFYVNTLALRTQFSKDDNFEVLLSKVKEVVLGAHAHQLYPFDELVSSLGLQRDMSRNPLFDVQVIVQNSNTDPTASLGLEGLSVESYTGEVSHSSVFDLVFNFIESEEGIIVSTIYNTDVFEYDWLVQMHTHLEILLEVMLTSPTASISQLSCLSAQEEVSLLEAFKTPKIAYDETATVVSLIEAQAKKTPEATAVYYEGISLSYQELDERSNQLAHYLIEEYGVVNNDLIGIMMDRSEQMFVGVLAILKSGGAYVPIDPEYPESRKSYILEDTKVKVLLTQSDYIFDLSYYEGNLFAMDLQLPVLTNPTSSPKVSISSDDLVYIIYTSGSTGNPKGVLVSHGNLMHSLAPRASVYGTIDRFLLLSSIAFDSSVAGIFSTLSTGGQLCITKSSDIANVPFIANYIVSEQISHLLTVPSYYRLLLDSLSGRDSVSLKGVTVAGEYCPMSLITDHYASHIGASGCDLFNEYGPTECTVWSTVHKYNPEDEVTSTIGKPIANTPIYLLNEEETLVPVGVVGELCIGGLGVTQGYLNRPDLTAEKFVDDPFNPGGKMYKTGDYGRWKLNGEIEFLGRKDDQVKIRGNRVELGEIQNALESYESIQSAIVLAKANSSGTNELYAYVKGDEDLSVPAIKKYLGDMLPSYAIPSNYTQVTSFPTTSNGKIDTKALLLMDAPELDSGVEYVAPSTEEERLLVEIWQEVLNKEKVGVKDHFFDLGGDSLKLIRLISLIHKVFNVNLEFKDIYEVQSLEDQVKAINRGVKTSFSRIPEIEKQDCYELSSSQRRIWVLSQIEASNVTYNMPAVYVFKGKLNLKAFNEAYKTLRVRHESLRTNFKEDESGKIKQFIKEKETVKDNIIFKDLKEDKEKKDKIKQIIDREFNYVFNLSLDDLLRCTLIKVEDDEWVFCYVIHHIISDGWSMNILIKELLTLYNAFQRKEDSPLTPLSVQYKDYAFWQQKELKKENTEKHKEYWLKQFAGDVPVLNLKTDYNRPAVKTFNGGIVTKKVEKARVEKFKELLQEEGTTLYMGLVTLVNVLLHRYTHQNDIIIGTPVAGRMHADLENQIGFYVNTLALRSKFEGVESYVEVLKKIKEVTLNAYKHQMYPFDELVGNLNLQRDLSRNVLFDVLIALQNTNISDDHLTEIKELEVYPYNESEYIVTKFDLTFNFNEVSDGLWLSLEYNSDLFKEATIKQITNHFIQIFECIIEKPNQKIQDIEYLCNSEKEQLIETFNQPNLTYNKKQTIVSIFEDQVKKTPNDIALIFQEKEFTFKEIDRESNKLAEYLIEKYGIISDDLVGLKLERSEWIIIAMLGIMKAGGGFVPIDVGYPQERKDYMIEDSSCKLIFDEKELYSFKSVSQKYRGKNLAKPSNVAYVIYTSGSLGKPKGVVIEHKNIVAFFESCKNRFGLFNITMPSLASNAFDIFLFEVFYPILTGGKILMLSNEQIRDMDLLTDELKKVNTFHAVPALMSQILNHIKSKGDKEEYYKVKDLFIGGDKVLSSTLEEMREVFPNANINELYGPTESTIFTITNNYYSNTCKRDNVEPITENIIDLFENQVKINSANIAVRFKEKMLTYKELDEEVNRLAFYLEKECFIKKGDFVGIALGRSERFIISILGILKLGAVYVPLDISYPDSRKKLIINDTEIKVLITETKYLSDFEFYKGDIVNLDTQPQEIEQKKYNRNNVLSNNLAYVMYTSGSTGIPKGVMIEHKSVVRLVKQTNYVDITPSDNVLSLSSFSFDGSIFDIFGALLNGATLHIALKEDYINNDALGNIISKNEISMFFITTALFNSLLDSGFQFFDRLRYVLFGGEQVSLTHVKKFKKKYQNVQLVHVYGPTENTTFSLAQVVDDTIKSNVPIGKPINNSYVYILDKNKKICPIGVVGEICVGGEGVARGYLNQPELTAEKFIPDPYRIGEVIYLTGDLGCWQSNGTIEFIGRKDNQVKIRGYRIELGEIESVLVSLESIQSAVVITKIFNEVKEIVAYVLSEEDLNVNDLRQALGKELPSFMLPSYFVQLKEFPLTPNGKIDKKSLPNPKDNSIQTGTKYIAAKTDEEKNLTEVLEKVLNKKSISVKDDFFALGGDSIKSIQVVSRLRERGYSLTIQKVMLNPIIENLAKHIKRTKRVIDQSEVKGIIPLTPIQSYFFENHSNYNHHYNQSVLLFSKNEVSKDGLQIVLDKIFQHHDALRMIYLKTEKGWRQENLGVEKRLEIKFSKCIGKEEFNKCCNDLQASMKLEEGPLFKAGVFKYDKGTYILLVAHHLVIDAVSWRILLEDFFNLYNQYSNKEELYLPSKTDSFKYWQEKQIEYSKSLLLKEEEIYWQRIDSLGNNFLEPDNKFGRNLIIDAEEQSFSLMEDITEILLTKCHKAYKTEINEILLTALSLALREVFNIEDLLIQMEGHGREYIGEDIDVSRTVGWFTTIYPVLLNTKYSLDIVRQLIEVKETLHRIPNKGIGYGILKYMSGIEFNTKPQITFNYLGDFDSGNKSEDQNKTFELLGDYHGDNFLSSMERESLLDINVMVIKGKLRFTIQYSKKQFEFDTINKVLKSSEKYLVDLITKLSVEKGAYVTPVDLTYKDLSIEELNLLNSI